MFFKPRTSSASMAASSRQPLTVQRTIRASPNMACHASLTANVVILCGVTNWGYFNSTSAVVNNRRGALIVLLELIVLLGLIVAGHHH